jgi:hypothetical protein
MAGNTANSTSNMAKVPLCVNNETTAYRFDQEKSGIENSCHTAADNASKVTIAEHRANKTTPRAGHLPTNTNVTHPVMAANSHRAAAHNASALFTAHSTERNCHTTKHSIETKVKISPLVNPCNLIVPLRCRVGIAIAQHTTPANNTAQHIIRGVLEISAMLWSKTSVDATKATATNAPKKRTLMHN